VQPHAAHDWWYIRFELADVQGWRRRASPMDGGGKGVVVERDGRDRKTGEDACWWCPTSVVTANLPEARARRTVVVSHVAA
jgi:hypothetical protein